MNSFLLSTSQIPTLPHRYPHLPPVITVRTTTHLHSQHNFDLAPSSHLSLAEVQDLYYGDRLYNGRQAIQRIQFVAAQVQGFRVMKEELECYCLGSGRQICPLFHLFYPIP